MPVLYDEDMTQSDAYRPKEPWDRRPEEPGKAYSAFEIYLGLPPAERTLKKAYRLHTRNHNAAGPSDHFQGWAGRHDWEERALAYDDAKAKARRDGELSGISSHWALIAEQKERVHTDLIGLATLAERKAREIYERELTKDNYSMAHAVQMSKFVLEIYKQLIELEKMHEGDEEGRWTDEDERAVAGLVEEVDAESANNFFEEALRRTQEEDGEDTE